jgi:hypothetical protein
MRGPLLKRDNMRSHFRILLTLASLAALATCVFQVGVAHHAVLRFNLEEMTQTADRIFLGRCTDVVETEELIAQGRLPVTVYTFQVEQAIKGSLSRRVTFRQLGHSSRRSLAKGEATMHGEVIRTDTFIHGMSEYRVGDRLILFLIPDYLGRKVTYPVGLYQGAFQVTRMPSGQDLVRNDINNIGLFNAPYNGTRMSAADARVIFPDKPVTGSAEIETLSRKRGALPLDQFVKAVEQIQAAHGGPRGVITQ